MASPLVKAAVAACATFVQPSLVAFYEADSRNRPKQVGTGVLVDYKGRPVVITASHVLIGHAGGADPLDKQLFSDELASMRDLGVTNLAIGPGRDIAAFYADALDQKPRLPFGVLTQVTPAAPKVITINGYLARDFHRDGETLRPAPYAYTDKRIAGAAAHLTMAYPKHRAVGTFTAEKVMTPTPAGLSGCPMLDTAELVKGNISIAGVFTDHRFDLGTAFGELADEAIRLVTTHL